MGGNKSPPELVFESGWRASMRKESVVLGRRGTPEERFDVKVAPSDSGCLLWLGSLNAKGYGHFNLNGRIFKAHRWAYERRFGPTPTGMQLDHLCSVRNCVNPDHLEPVTNWENSRRARQRHA
jgi:hypothetical protein